MTGAIQSSTVNNGAMRSSAAQQSGDPKATAQAILNETSGKPATYDKLGQIEARLDAIARTNPEFASQVRAEIMASPNLTASQKGTLVRNEPGRTVDIDGKTTSHYKPGGMAWDPWINKERAANTAEYKALAKLAGSNQNEPIKAVMQELYDRGMTTEQLATARLNQASAAGVDMALVADIGQVALDIIGIFDPTGISDGANALISAGRGDWVGAALSAVSIIPFVGDLAKAGKLGKWATTVAKAVDAAINNPAARAALEPALRKLNDALAAVPDSVMRNLPTELKNTIDGIKGKLDELFGAAKTKVDDVALAAAKTVERTFGKNSAKWITDAEGRLVSASAELKQVFPGLKRSGDEVAAQGRAADKGIAGDHGGHAVPHRFMGDQGDINLFPQNGVATAAGKNFNGSAFKTLENELADWVQAGGTVKYDVKFSDFARDRPGRVSIEYKVFDNAGNEVFRRRSNFRNEAGQVFERMSRNDVQATMRGAQ